MRSSKFSSVLAAGVAAAFALMAAPVAKAQLFTEHHRLFGNPNDNDEAFGLEVAASSAGDTILVGTPGNPRENTPAYVFARSAAGWNLQQTLSVPGGDVAVDGDTLVAGGVIYVRSGGSWTVQHSVPVSHSATALLGDTLVVGSPFDRVQSRGSVSIYVRNGTTWTEQAYFTPETGAPTNENYGDRVAFDGDTVIVGTHTQNTSSGAYVLVREGTTWSRQGRLVIPSGSGWMDVAVEGNTAVVGDPANNRVHLFTRSGSTWTLTQTIVAPSMGGMYFGNRVELSGGILAIDARQIVYLYSRTASAWTFAQTIDRPEFVQDSLFLAHRGKLLVIGAPTDTTPGQGGGAAEVYSVPIPPAPGSGWQSVDVGPVGVAGSSSVSGSQVSVSGSGSDIWHFSDGFHYRTETLTGDGAIIARVASTGGSHSWAKVGLMAREDLSPSARNVMALVTPAHHIGLQSRADPVDSTAYQDAGWAGAPIWLMLARSGNAFGAYRSDDGENWTLMSTATVSMTPTIYFGLAVSSHDNSALNTGIFDGIEIVPLGAPPPPDDPPFAPSQLTGSLSGPTSVQLAWTDHSADETGFVMERATGSGAFAVIASLGANVTSYNDNGLAATTTYSYRVRAVRGSTSSGYSNTFTLTTGGTGGPGPSPLTGSVIGAGSSGSLTGADGSFTIDARGSDIWGNADSGYFLNQTITGDFDIRARVDELLNTHPWAKAGVMVRASLGAGAANLFTLITADNASGLQVRPVAGDATLFSAGPWVRAPYWVRLTRVGNTFEGFISSNGVNWTQVGTVSLPFPAQLYAGVAVSSHNSSASTRARVSSLSFGASSEPPPPPPPPPPSPEWNQANLGSGNGSATLTSSSVAISGRGSDIWNQADAGNYVYRSWSGDGSIVARLDSLTDGHSWSKAGLMFRTGLNAGAANAFIAVTPDNGALFQVRATDSASTSEVQHNWLPGAPCWLRLTRAGNTFSAAFSFDGTNWTPLGSATFAAPTTLYVGFAVSSHTDTTTTSASFSSYSVQ